MKALGLNLLTDKQLNKLITEAWDKGYDQGHKVGHTRGYKEGHREGITTDRKGLMITSSGIYNFTDNEFTHAIIADDNGLQVSGEDKG